MLPDEVAPNITRPARPVGWHCRILSHEDHELMLIRRRGLRPRCEACAGVKSRSTIEIAHSPGEEIQSDWLELSGAPEAGTVDLLCEESKPGLIQTGGVDHSFSHTSGFLSFPNGRRSEPRS